MTNPQKHWQHAFGMLKRLLDERFSMLGGNMKNPLETLIGRRRAIAVARAREMARARREDFPAANIPSIVGRFVYRPNAGKKK